MSGASSAYDPTTDDRSMSEPTDPRMDLTSIKPSEELLGECEDLTSKVYDALRKLLGPRPSLREALEMKWLLLLAIKAMRDLGAPTQLDRDTWVKTLRGLAEDAGGVRQHAGTMIATFFEKAPWGLQKQPGASSLDTVKSANAIDAGVVQFCRQLTAQIKVVEEEGIALEDYDVDEARAEEAVFENDWSEEEDESTTETTPKPQLQLKTTSASKTATKARGRKSQGVIGHGNHAHGRPMPCPTAEHIGLLELYRDNPDRKLVSHPQFAIRHNTRFWPKVGEGRTAASVSQQYLKLVNHDPALIPAKLVELRQLLATPQ